MRTLLLAFLAWGTASTAAAPEPLPEFEATYTVRYGLLRGALVLRLSRRGDGYVYETSLRPQGLAALFARGTIHESTRLVDDGSNVRPVAYERTDTIADPARIARYFFTGDRVAGTYKGQQIDLPMRPGGQNRISVHIAVMQALRCGSKVATFAVFDRSRWKEYRFEVIPDQFVKTSSGQFDTIEVRYRSPGDEKASSLYFAPSLEFLPVMIVYSENGKAKSRAELTDYRIEGFDAAREPSRTGAVDAAQCGEAFGVPRFLSRTSRNSVAQWRAARSTLGQSVSVPAAVANVGASALSAARARTSPDCESLSSIRKTSDPGRAMSRRSGRMSSISAPLAARKSIRVGCTAIVRGPGSSVMV